MKCNMISLNGKPFSAGQTVTVDHQITEFTVKIRAMNSVGANQIKQLLQEKYEVLEVKETSSTKYVIPSPVADF